MKLKNTKIVIIAVSILCIVATLICLVFLLQQPEDRLSEEQIAALRAEYPIRTTLYPPYVNVMYPSLETTKKIAASFVYAEVIKVEIVAEREDCTFCDYTFSVIDDTRNKLKKGEKIVFSDGTRDGIYTIPLLKEGMKIVFPVMKHESEDQYQYMKGCEYYVTDDGYVMSAFDEERAEVTPPLSGIKLKKLMRELKK